MFAFKSALNLTYELMKDATEFCMPTPLVNCDNNFILHSKINTAIASDSTQRIPTGIRLLNLPTFTLQTTDNGVINLYTEATCRSMDNLRANYGVEVIGPTVITPLYTDEIYVTVVNHSKSIFELEQGDDIALLTFNIKPIVNFEIDMVSHSIAPELR